MEGPVLCAAQDQLAASVCESHDLQPPLGFQRSGADHQHFGDIGIPGQQFGHADTLNRFSQPHVIGQNCPSRTHGKSDAVKLIGTQFGLKKRRAQGVVLGIFPNGIDLVFYPVPV